MPALCKGQVENAYTPAIPETLHTSHLYVFADDGQLMSFDSTSGEGVIIQNSYPKGDRYYHPSGGQYGCAVFWTRVLNNTPAPIELSVHFRADSIPLSTTPNAFMQIFLPPETMTADKESMYNYGAEGIYSFLDAGLPEESSLKQILDPREEYMFYVGVLGHESSGIIRTGMVLKEEGLFYRIMIDPHYESTLFPCGKIDHKR